jgi:hypothetical protein
VVVDVSEALVKHARDDSRSRQDQSIDSLVHLPLLPDIKLQFLILALFDIVACLLWVNGISVPINATYLFVLSISVTSGPL